MHPFGINDRIDSLPNKSDYNCTFSMFISDKVCRKRSWSRVKNKKPLLSDSELQSLVNNQIILIRLYTL